MQQSMLEQLVSIDHATIFDIWFHPSNSTELFPPVDETNCFKFLAILISPVLAVFELQSISQCLMRVNESRLTISK
jgi:hypothetical protein